MHELEHHCVSAGESFVSSAVPSLSVCPLHHSQTYYSKSQFSHFMALLQNPSWFPISCKARSPNLISMAFHSLDPACFHFRLLLLLNCASKLQSHRVDGSRISSCDFLEDAGRGFGKGEKGIIISIIWNLYMPLSRFSDIHIPQPEVGPLVECGCSDKPLLTMRECHVL